MDTMTGEQKTLSGIVFVLAIVAGFLLVSAYNLHKDYFMQSWQGMDDFAMGQYYFNHGDNADGSYDINKARGYYQKVVAENPTANVLAWHQLGRINFLEGKFDEAIGAFENQITYFEDELPNVYYMLGLTYGYKAKGNPNSPDWQQAEKNFVTYLTYDPHSPWARVDLTWIYFAQGKFQEMLPVLEVGLAEYPDNPWLLNMYGLALLNTGDKTKAHAYFMWAKEEADSLTVEEWGKSYPGNDPSIWGAGLTEFRSIIEKNVELTEN